MASAVSGTSADDFDVPAGMGKAYYEEPKEEVKSDKKNDKEDKKEESASKDDSQNNQFRINRKSENHLSAKNAPAERRPGKLTPTFRCRFVNGSIFLRSLSV